MQDDGIIFLELLSINFCNSAIINKGNRGEAGSTKI